MAMFIHIHLNAMFPNVNIGACFLPWACGPAIVADIASGCLVRLVRSGHILEGIGFCVATLAWSC
jgi:hypothetical protein